MIYHNQKVKQNKRLSKSQTNCQVIRNKNIEIKHLRHPNKHKKESGIINLTTPDS